VNEESEAFENQLSCKQNIVGIDRWSRRNCRV